MQDETERLRALEELDILDSAPEESFDEAARMAATICGAPTAMVNLLDRDRQWFKARVGIPVCELPRKGSICDLTIGRTTPLVIADASQDHRVRENRHVTGDPNVRFYAGAPLNTSEGYTFGTLCVVDTVPHQLTQEQTDALAALGRQVSAQMELQAKVRLLARVVCDKERIERELRERSAQFSAFMDHSPTIGFIKDSEGRFLYYNSTFCERFGVTPTEWIGKNVFDLFPKEFAATYHATDMEILRSGVAQVVEETSPGPDMRTLYWRTHKFRISTEGGPDLLGGLSLDTSHEHETAEKLRRSHEQLRAMNMELMELSVTDGLTGLRNRRNFDERLARKIATGISFSLLLLDVDHFKALNDCFGHKCGDDVLRTLAELLNENTRVADSVFRYGGEEFAILLPDTSAEDALAMAERLRTTVADFPWKQRAVTLSAGVGTRAARHRHAADLLDEVDAALYRAKHLGRNRVVAADEPGAEEQEVVYSLAS